MLDPIRAQINEHLETVQALDRSAPVIDEVAGLLIGAFKAGRRLYVLGNGGSAADAQHIAAELVGRFKEPQRRALPAVALTTDTSSLTAVGNDFGFQETFKRQVAALVQAQDVLWALSVSGRSPNVIEAVKTAREAGARVIGFTGEGGTALAELSDVCLIAPHADSARVQEVHQLAYHIICGLIDKAFA
jgi:D-sedoheptulose 7-phosphate isomerase